MKFSLTGVEKSDLLIQVTAWASLTVLDCIMTVRCLVYLIFPVVLRSEKCKFILALPNKNSLNLDQKNAELF